MFDFLQTMNILTFLRFEEKLRQNLEQDANI